MGPSGMASMISVTSRFARSRLPSAAMRAGVPAEVGFAGPHAYVQIGREFPLGARREGGWFGRHSVGKLVRIGGEPPSQKGRAAMGIGAS